MTTESQRFLVPPQRVKWIMRELAQAGIQPKMERGQDGFVFFTVDDRGAAVIEKVIDYKSKRKFGTHPAHRFVNTLAALVATVAAAGGIYQAVLAGSYLLAAATVGLIVFIWWARSILNSDRSAARLFQPIKPRGRSTKGNHRQRRRSRHGRR